MRLMSSRSGRSSGAVIPQILYMIESVNQTLHTLKCVSVLYILYNDSRRLRVQTTNWQTQTQWCLQIGVHSAQLCCVYWHSALAEVMTEHQRCLQTEDLNTYFIKCWNKGVSGIFKRREKQRTVTTAVPVTALCYFRFIFKLWGSEGETWDKGAAWGERTRCPDNNKDLFIVFFTCSSGVLPNSQRSQQQRVWHTAHGGTRGATFSWSQIWAHWHDNHIYRFSVTYPLKGYYLGCKNMRNGHRSA